ncbi:MAG TPA: hypothetical protein VM759_03860 [Longimicrobium sp.]|nr:hypothetical protein [Longimicrobium sp.]
MIRHSAGIWLLVRVAYVGVLMAAMFVGLLPEAEGTVLVLHPTWMTRGLLVALTSILVWLDRSRSSELLLPANLGAWPGWFWTASLLTALVLDITVQALLLAAR